MTVPATRRLFPLFSAVLVDCVAPTIPRTTAAVMMSLNNRLLYMICAKGLLRGGMFWSSSRSRTSVYAEYNSPKNPTPNKTWSAMITFKLFPAESVVRTARNANAAIRMAQNRDRTT